MEFPAQAYVKRILRTNHGLYGFEEAGNFISQEERIVRHFVSALRISIDKLPENYKKYFNRSRVLARPWRDPGLEELWKISIRNDKPLSYTVQFYFRLNTSIYQNLRSFGYAYIFDQISVDGRNEPRMPQYPNKDYAKRTLKTDNEQIATNYSQNSVHRESQITKLSEKDMFALLKEKCEEHCVPNALIPKLLPILMRYAKTGKAPAILLTGSPGVGKTTLSRIIGEVLGLEVCLASAQSMATSRGLVGDSKTYRNAGCGFIADAKKRFGNPLILIDELDKVSSRRDSVHNLQDELLSAIDGSRVVHDLYLDEDISTASILFMLTANEEKNIPRWLSDRCTVIRFPDPDLTRILKIVKRRVIEISTAEPYVGRISIKEDTIDELTRHMFSQGQVSLRQYLSVIDEIYDEAYLDLLENGKTTVEASEDMVFKVLASRAGNGRIRFGFEI